MLDEQIDAIDKLMAAAERFDQVGPYAVVFLVLIVFIFALLVAAIYFRFQGKDKDLDNKNIEELRGIRKELVETRLTISGGLEAIKDRSDDNFLVFDTRLNRQSVLLKRVLRNQRVQISAMQKLVERIEAIPQTFQAEMNKVMTDFVTVLGHERASIFTEDKFEFPPEDDCRWQKAFMKPVNGRMVHVHRTPVFHDKNVAGLLASGGEAVSVILHPTIAGWCIVRMCRVNEPVRGWVYKNAVEVQVLGEEAVREGKADGNTP